MANYVASNLLAAQVNIASKMQSAEMRFRDPVAFKSLIANQPFIMDGGYEQYRTREDRDVQVNFFNRTARALGTGRSHTHAGAKGDTTIVTPSFATKNDDFFYSIKQADKNKRTLQEMLENELKNTFSNFAEGMEDLSASFLFNNRSGVNGVTQEGTFNATNDVFEIAAANGDRRLQITKAVMNILKYKGLELDIYCDTIAWNQFEFLRAQGGANSTNTEYQFTSGGTTFYHVPELDTLVAGLAAGIYNKGFWCAVPKGMAVAMDWIPVQNRQGVSQNTIGGVAEYGNIINPVDGLVYATHKLWTGFDGTATNGYTQDVKEDVEVSLDVSFEHAPLTVAGETPIQAFVMV